MNCLFTETECRPGTVLHGLDLPGAESMLLILIDNIILSGCIQHLIFKDELTAEKKPFDEILIY